MKKENIQFSKAANLKPSTKEVCAVRCQFNDKDLSCNDIVIVDTPSFHTDLHKNNSASGEDVLKQWVGEK